MMTTLVMDISVIAILMTPISDISDHCMGFGCIGDDHVSGDDIGDGEISDLH